MLPVMNAFLFLLVDWQRSQQWLLPVPTLSVVSEPVHENVFGGRYHGSSRHISVKNIRQIQIYIDTCASFTHLPRYLTIGTQRIDSNIDKRHKYNWFEGCCACTSIRVVLMRNHHIMIRAKRRLSVHDSCAATSAATAGDDITLSFMVISELMPVSRQQRYSVE